MLIHFICRGNAFRSRIAEAYLNSLQKKNLTAISSGTVAQAHSESNEENFKITNAILGEHGIEKYNKKHWDQLTKNKLNDGDVVIFLNENVLNECKKLYGLPEKFIVWDINDFDEISPIPVTENDLHHYAELTYLLIKKSVDSFIANIAE